MPCERERKSYGGEKRTASPNYPTFPLLLFSDPLQIQEVYSTSTSFLSFQKVDPIHFPFSLLRSLWMLMIMLLMLLMCFDLGLLILIFYCFFGESRSNLGVFCVCGTMMMLLERT